jgi:DNA-binding NarL/FixJ family response regulator
MRILVVDDHEVIRRGICSLLASQPGCEICGEAVDGRDAVNKALELRPELVIMDVSMPNLNGLEATRLIRRSVPSAQVLILTQHDSPEMIRQAFRAGAHGFVVKSSVARDLVNAVEAAQRGLRLYHRGRLMPAPKPR